MKILTTFSALAEVQGPIYLAAGVFDGVHLGHQAVLNHASALARQSQGTAVALTFDPHPLKILNPASAPKLLTTTKHKLRLIQFLGYSHSLVLRFDKELASLTGRQFIEKLAHSAQNLLGVVVGCDWRFGNAKSGNLDLIHEMGRELSFQAIGIPVVCYQHSAISSTRIRSEIQSGNLTTAAKMLGRPFEVFGTVVPGQQLGRKLGFPTANLHTHDEILPPDGVYIGQATGTNLSKTCLINIGFRPTIEQNSKHTVEAHLLDFHGDLYGQDLTLQFNSFLRPESKFRTLDELKSQIQRDVAQALLSSGQVRKTPHLLAALEAK